MTEPQEAVDQGFYIYGVVPSGTALTSTEEGMGEGGLVTREGDGVAVVGEWIDVSRPLGRKRHLVAHTEVLNALASQGPVLPLQFGSVVASEEAAVEEFLDTAHDRLAELLESLRGLRQYVVRARYDADQALAEVVRDNPEVAELRQYTSQLSEHEGYAQRVRLGELVSAAMEQRRAADGAWLREQLTGLVEDVVPHDLAGMDALTEFAVCVREDLHQEFEARMEDLAEEVHTWARLSLVGPMALFDFVPEA